MDDWVIEGLKPSHQRAEFACGKASLDVFLRKLVSQYEKRRLGRTFVATEPGQARVAGYYTLAAGSFAESRLPAEQRKHLPKHPVPTIHLGRLAVDTAYRGRRLGETLLIHALRAALALSEKLGAFAGCQSPRRGSAGVLPQIRLCAVAKCTLPPLFAHENGRGDVRLMMVCRNNVPMASRYRGFLADRLLNKKPTN
jgi:hypothetical protein